MKELKCPNCGNVFQVDEADYASIVNQVKTVEFEAEVKRRMAELDERLRVEQELAKTKSEKLFQLELEKRAVELERKESEISKLKRGKGFGNCSS